MKTTLLALAFALPCALLAQSIAVVDMERVLANHPNTPNDQKTLEATLADYSKERDALRVELERLAGERDQTIKDAQNPMLAAAKAEELRQRAAQQDRALQEAAQRAEAQMAERSRTLSEMERRFIKRTTDEIQAHIKAEAKKKGYDVVLYKDAVPYVKPDCDITDRIIVLCGGIPPKADTAKDGEELAPPAKTGLPAAK